MTASVSLDRGPFVEGDQVLILAGVGAGLTVTVLNAADPGMIQVAGIPRHNGPWGYGKLPQNLRYQDPDLVMDIGL
jgi:hypothetical protein